MYMLETAFRFIMEETPLLGDVCVMLAARHSVHEPLIGTQLRVVAKLVRVCLLWVPYDERIS